MRFHLKAAAITAAAFALPLIASVVRAVPSSPQKGNPDMPMLNWAGKSKVVNHHNDVPFRVLERKWGVEDGVLTQSRRAAECAENMIIHGDNLAALKALLPQYEGKVKCIYIDPPYNTGNEGWVYNDNVNDPQIKKWLGEVVGKEGEDFSRHDKWLCMMYPRLRLLQKLLAEDGAIFISIDDNELYSLKFICDEIFGSSNFLGTIVRATGTTTGQDSDGLGKAFDYVVAYRKSIIFKVGGIELSEDDKKRYNLKDERGYFSILQLRRTGGEDRREDRPTMYFPIKAPDGTDVYPIGPGGYESRWRVGPETVAERIKNNELYFKKEKGQWKVYYKYYLDERTKRPSNLWSDIDGNKKAQIEIKQLFGKPIFETPKPVALIERILKIATDNDSIVLDSFAGSGTTAHAVLKMNKEDGGSRKFILIEMMDYADKVTAERVKRVISGYGQGDKAVEGTGGGFGYYELGEPLMIGENLNENLPIEKIREYVWYMETRGAGNVAIANANNANGADPYLLGVADGAAYYFCYERGATVKLNRALLRKLKTKAERYVVYADICLLDDSELEKYNIAFKKIPRDIAQL